MSVKKTQDPIIVTPPKPLPIPSPTQSLQEGEQGTSEAEVVTEPKARFVGSTHEEIPEWPGPYHVTENGLYECAGYEFSTDLLVEVAPKGLTEITIEDNGVYKPDDYDGYSKVTVAIPTYNGSYSVSANGTLSTKDKLMTDDLVVNVAPNLVALTATENKTYTPTAPVQGFSSVTVNVPVGGNTLKTLLDATKSTYQLFNGYSGNDIADLISYDDTSEVTNMTSMFIYCANITSIPLLNTSKVTTMSQTFRHCSSLSSVPALDASKVTSFSNTFGGCSALTEIKMTGMNANFDISASTLFTREALVEIITNCAALSSGTAYTLTMGATNLAKLTQADIDIATYKGWNLA